VYDELKAHAEPFVDTPNTVLRRLLGLDTAAAGDDEDLIDRASENGQLEDLAPVSPSEPPMVPSKASPRRRHKRGSKLPTTKHTRAPAGALLAEDEYEIPMLEALVELGGSAPSRQVIERVGKILDSKLTPLDREPLISGGIRWQSRVQFVRLRLIQQGLMIKETGRGVWAISDSGRTHLRSNGQKAGGND
jgi:hypothetical protein